MLKRAFTSNGRSHCAALRFRFRCPNWINRHFDRAPLTSGLPRQADILRVFRHVSKVPEPDCRPAIDLRWIRFRSIFRSPGIFLRTCRPRYERLGDFRGQTGKFPYFSFINGGVNKARIPMPRCAFPGSEKRKRAMTKDDLKKTADLIRSPCRCPPCWPNARYQCNHVNQKCRVAVIALTDPNDQESVVLLPEPVELTALENAGHTLSKDRRRAVAELA
jgi:hypothetical protein